MEVHIYLRPKIIDFFVKKTQKNVSRGLFSREAQIFFYSAHLLIHTNLLKKKVSQYLQRFSNFGWGHDL